MCNKCKTHAEDLRRPLKKTKKTLTAKNAANIGLAFALEFAALCDLSVSTAVAV